jgi:two-component system NtrC family sensor kinase
MNQHLTKVVDPDMSGSSEKSESGQPGLFFKEKPLYELALLGMIGRITPEVVHDINNLMTGILGYAELLLMKKIEDPSIRNGLKNILLSAEKTKGLLDNLLILSHQDSPSLSLVNINDLLGKVLDMRSCALRHRQIEVVRELDKDIPTIALDGPKFQKAILSLIFKSEEILEKQSPEKELRLETSYIPQKREILIRISDNFIDTPLNALLYLGETDQGHLSPDLGISLGLEEAGRWIGSLGGAIEFQSQTGKGTTFSVHLPVKEFPGA